MSLLRFLETVAERTMAQEAPKCRASCSVSVLSSGRVPALTLGGMLGTWSVLRRLQYFL